jgi:hypothetical protein
MKRCLALLLVAAAPVLPAQQVLRGAAQSEKILPVRLDVDLRALPKPKVWQPGDPIKEVPRRRTRPVKPVPEPVPQLDPLLALQRQADAAAGRRAIRAFTTLRVNVAGQGFTGASPPDTVGDVGPAHFIQAVNDAGGTLYTVYSKTNGAVLAGPFTLSALGGTGACATGGGDPIVLYDELAGRWLLSEFADSGNNLCIYISQTADPISGGWFNYRFTLTEFPDYPKYAVWPDAYYVGANESSPALYALDRTNMLAGAAATFQRFTAPVLTAFDFQIIAPVDLDGATPPPAGAPGLFIRHRDDEAHNAGSNNPATDFLELYSFAVDWDTPANSTLTGPVSIPVAEFDSHLCGYTSFSCIQQQGSATTLDPLREPVMNRPAFRSFGAQQSLVGCFATDVTGTDQAGIRWFELRRTGLGPWSLYQEGTYAPDAHSRWMGSIAMDGSGNMALGYNVSSSTLFPGLRYTGRLAGDPLGTMPQGETVIVNGSAASGSNRYGDYAAMGVDPANGCQYWFTGEYNASANWSTRIASFSFDTCGCTPRPAPAGVSATANGPNRIDVSWTAVSGASSYEVYRSAGPCPGAAYAFLTNTAATVFTNTGLSGGSIYSYVVRSYVATSACSSTNSACVQATAAGACTLPPVFSGLAAVSNLAQSTCVLRLTWPPAAPACSTTVAYNVYRSTNAVFTPSAATRIASCIGTTRFDDATAADGRTNYYLVRAEDPALAGSGPCAGGTEDTNLVIRSGVASGSAIVFFADMFEAGAGQWVEAALTTANGTPWALANTDFRSASTSYFCAALDTFKDRAVSTAAPVALPAGSSPILEFWHRMAQESGFDGGVLEYSTNNVTWSDILAANGTLPANAGRFVAGGYNDNISTGYSSPIGGRSAWSGTIGGVGAFSRVAVSLADFAGRSVYFRWRLACDESELETGWWVDDVTVSLASPCAPGGYSAWRTNFTWLVGSGQPNEDANGDGISNFESYFYGLNPTSVPPAAAGGKIPQLILATNGLRYIFTPDTNDAMAASYRIEQTLHVQTGAWTTLLPTPAPGTNGQVVLPVGPLPTNLFLRVRMAE